MKTQKELIAAACTELGMTLTQCKELVLESLPAGWKIREVDGMVEVLMPGQKRAGWGGHLLVLGARVPVPDERLLAKASFW